MDNQKKEKIVGEIVKVFEARSGRVVSFLNSLSIIHDGQKMMPHLTIIKREEKWVSRTFTFLPHLHAWRFH